jgi:hypothetical protein
VEWMQAQGWIKPTELVEVTPDKAPTQLGASTNSTEEKKGVNHV